MKRRAGPSYDLVSAEASQRIEGWTGKARTLFAELLEDAPSDMQRELLNRAVAAGHTPAEVHAFADALRGLSDQDAFDQCTLEPSRMRDYTVVQLLKAEADPLFAFTLQGGELSPSDDPSMRSLLQYSPPGSPGRARPGIEAADPRLLPWHKSRELGQSERAFAPRASPEAAGALAQDLINAAVQPLGVIFQEHAIDGAGQLTLEEGLALAAAALKRGLPVPAVLGSAPGKDLRFALVLQLQQTGNRRAYQLFEVHSQEIAWVNEGDLIARAELPFSNAQCRRITRLAVPI